MIFRFIRYTQPAWLFNVVPDLQTMFPSCYIGCKDLDDITKDEQYETLQAQIADAGFRLCNKGMLLQSNLKQVNDVSQLPAITLKDEYTFIRKYWGNAWTVFAYLLRIVTFKNIFKETKAFFNTAKVKKVSLFSDPVSHEAYEVFDSNLVKNAPLVAVIIPTLNRYKYLKDALHDLERQSYTNFEVVIVDQSDFFDERFYQQFLLRLKVIHQKDKKLWTARNTAIKSTKADFLLFFDDDSRVESNWISEHLKCIDFFGADISAGVSLAMIGQKISESYNYFRWATQFDSGNALVRRKIFKQIGLFDEQFNGMRMGDGEFSYRVYSNGVRSISNYKAARVHLKVKEGGLREMGSWDAFRPTKWFAPKPVPSVVYLYKKYLPGHLYKNAMLIGIMLSNISYRNKRSSNMLLLSVILTAFKSPLLFIQYKRSCQIAEKMLKRGYQPELLIK